MTAPPNVFWDPKGHLHTNALHWEGFCDIQVIRVINTKLWVEIDMVINGCNKG
jgi:hypothetical protein